MASRVQSLVRRARLGLPHRDNLEHLEREAKPQAGCRCQSEHGVGNADWERMALILAQLRWAAPYSDECAEIFVAELAGPRAPSHVLRELNVGQHELEAVHPAVKAKPVTQYAAHYHDGFRALADPLYPQRVETESVVITRGTSTA